MRPAQPTLNSTQPAVRLSLSLSRSLLKTFRSPFGLYEVDPSALLLVVDDVVQ